MQWLENHWYRITPLHLVLFPISLLFWMLARVRRTLYRVGVLESVKLPVPVIVAGNITAGGSGKTPLVLWLAEALISRGYCPGIISRGYGGTNTQPHEVIPNGTPESSGDEPLLMAKRNLCPVWVGRDRAAAGEALLNAHPECDVLISDDGLQHYRLKRDVEIVVVDGQRRFGNGLILPAGPLREGTSRLKEANAVVINGGEAKPGEYAMTLHGARLTNLLNPGVTRQPGDFRNARLAAIAGIGNPQRFFNHLKALNLDVKPLAFPDHYRYVASDLEFPGIDALLMTEKDAVKCAQFANEKHWVLRVDAELDAALLQNILKRIAPHGRQTA
jgi:tetraacyldisaccharide 4'-kinase